MPTDREFVEAAIARHGLTVPPDEVDLFVANYAPCRAALEALYRLNGVRYEEPAVIFNAMT
ncbi:MULTISPECIES: hypothetical protein [unclassified Streptomyces]|uniref:hypothetical protein n=1 Tax=unclassified Streptomyces TaxID=2593676 RepID=UPI00278C89DB|nr:MULTISPECIES: hypothetical protein [unclassified Streptomyces]